MHTFYKFRILPLLIFVMPLFSLSQTVNILPLGNSITQSNNEHYSYRYPLWTQLIDAGLDFNFVGSLTSNYGGTPVYPPYNGQNFDQDHEGHWGWRCDQILNGLPNWLPNYTPDIALIHLGTNDLYQGSGNAQNIAETIDELKDIITLLRNDNPDVIILLATLIPSTNPLLVGKISSFNSSIPQIAVDMYNPDSPIIIVDQYDGFDAANDTFDGVHPNENGEVKMAVKWKEAIVNAMGSGLRMNLKIFLEGPFNGIEMETDIAGEIPLMQPFSDSPWNYQGGEILSALPAETVDWILVELRDTTSANLADASVVRATKACLLTSEGHIVDTSGSSELFFDVEISNDLFVVVFHRNHLPVISSGALQKSGDIYTWDFTTDASQALGSSDALKQLAGGYFGMYAGDMNGDGFINSTDYSAVWTASAGGAGYLQADCNLDSKAGNKDKNDFWIINNGKFSLVP